jgi:hypothetical protein
MSKNRVTNLEQYNEWLNSFWTFPTTCGFRPAYEKVVKYYELAGNSGPNAENFWIWRELIRSSDNTKLKTLIHTYTPVVFAAEPWVDPLHFVHVSDDDNTMLAYTPNPEKGRQDVQIRMKVGKYLQKYYAEHLDNEAIKKWVDRHREKCEEGLILWASTEDEIEEVYLNGPQSCMDGRADQMRYWEVNTGGVHPVRAYAGPDTVVAYTKRDGRINARTVCHIGVTPPRYTRVYGDSMLATRLREMGFVDEYSGGSNALGLDGARLLKLPAPGKQDFYILPYLDTPVQMVEIDGDYIRIARNGDSAAATREGRVYIENPAGHEPCVCCGNMFSPRKLTPVHGGGKVCASCRDTHYVSTRISDSIDMYARRENTIIIDGRRYLDNVDKEALGLVQLRAGEWTHRNNALPHHRGGFIRNAGGAFCCGVKDGVRVFAMPDEIRTNTWRIGGDAYSKELYHPHCVPAKMETQTLMAFLQDVVRSKHRANITRSDAWGTTHYLLNLSNNKLAEALRTKFDPVWDIRNLLDNE